MPEATLFKTVELKLFIKMLINLIIFMTNVERINENHIIRIVYLYVKPGKCFKIVK